MTRSGFKLKNYNFNNLEGRTFDRWNVIREAGRNKSGNVLWECVCRCGTKRIVVGASLRNGTSRSCGCLSKEKTRERRTKHGMYGTRFYIIWNAMHNRCNNPSQDNYERYGGRGIRVCSRWKDFENFKDDLYDLYMRHVEEFGEKNTTIDRIDVDGNYAPDNVKWSTIIEQSRNKRKRKGGRIRGIKA